MRIYNVHANALDTHELANSIVAKLNENDTKFDAIIGYFNTKHDAQIIYNSLAQKYDCPIMLASSCNGAFGLMNGSGDCYADISLFAISDPTGHYGVGCANTNIQDPANAASEALNSALSNSKLLYETPTLIWSIMPPGEEEALLKGFTNIVGPRVPIFGGSSADNEVVGSWFQMTKEKVSQDLVIAMVMHPSKPIGCSYSSGYHPTDTKLIAENCDGRTVQSLNGVDAATEYNTLTKQSISHALKGGNVLGDTTLHPLGKLIDSPAGVPEYLLCHPDSVTTSKGLSLFSIVDDGQEFFLMEGSIEGLVNRAAMVIQNAIQLLPDGKSPAGILMIYCAGCMLTVGDKISEMQASVQNLVGDLPVCGAYTFGEQGCFLDGTNRHGNLMISAVVFSQ